jgi:F-box interacting protein
MSSRELPEDLLTEILSKLPVKCLGRFKCVSKSWYALITNPNFITKHVTWANSHNPHRRAILSHSNEWGYGYPLVATLSNDTLELSGDVDLLQLFQPQDGEALFFFGACNGIICLASEILCEYEYLVLWNPATGESKMLPPINRPSDVPAYYSIVGFGFDSKTNDYKVVRILHYNSQYEVVVYSLSADSWRVIDSSLSPSYSIHLSRYPSYVNGVDHWWASDTNDTGKVSRPFLLSFDMSTEVFQKVLLPPIEASLIEDFAVINDSVALILRRYDEFDYSFDIWVLNESGVERTWTKLLTIGRIPSCLSDLIQLREDGSVVLKDPNTGGLGLYDPRTQEVRDLRINGAGSCHELFSYTESIVFLNGSGHLFEHQDSSLQDSSFQNFGL